MNNMDGRDNPNENPSLDNSTPRRAIFSSGDTPTPAEPNPDQSSNSVIGPRLGGVVSATGPSNSLNSPNAADAAYIAAHPTVTKSTATGDLVFNKPKKSKKWVIIMVALAALAVLAIFGFAFLSKPSQEEVSESFQTYYNYMYQGPEEGYSNTESWFLVQLTELNNIEIDQNKYVAELTQYYNQFHEKFIKGRLKLDQESKQSLQDTVEEYGQLLNAMTVYANMQNIVQSLQLKTIQDGNNAAIQSIPSYITITTDSSSTVDEFNNALADVLENTIHLVEIYNNNNCIDEDSDIIFSCVVNLGRRNSQVISLMEKGEELNLFIQQQLPTIRSKFKIDTQKIMSTLENGGK